VGRPKKIQHFKHAEYTNPSGNVSWRVTGQLPNGTRVRKNFSKEIDAIQAVADLEAELAGQPEVFKNQRTRLSAEQLAIAEAAIRAADGRDLSTIVTHYLALESRVRSKEIDLNTAISFVDGHYRAEIQTVSVLAAYEQFLSSRSSSSAKTMNHYESSLRLLLKQDPNKALHTFTVSDIEKILSRYRNVNSKRTYRRAFSTFFGWAIRHHFCLEDPCKRLDKLPRDMSQIAVLSFDEAKRLLYAAMSYRDGATAAAVAIGLFAGLRPSEIKDLKSEDIGDNGIRVSGGKLRRQLKRTVPIPPVLASWLEEYPFTGLPGGWSFKMKKVKAATNASKWVQDIIRHTSITFQTERDKNEALTAYNCGTSIQMMNLHYRNTIGDGKAVTKFWNLTPETLLEEKPEVTLPELKKVVWPEKKSLTKLVWKKPLMHIALDIGVSDVALKKHCVKLGLDLPARGYWLRERRDQRG
jgi:integrase